MTDLQAQLEAERECRFCGHKFTLMVAHLREAPARGRGSEVIAMPRCPKCDKPYLTIAASTDAEVVSR